MPMQFIIKDTTSGRLYVERYNATVSFMTVGGASCWATTDDVRKLISELDEMVAAIDSDAS